MKRGLLASFCVAMNAALNLSTCPTCKMTLFLRASLIRMRACLKLSVMGFSIKTCFFCKIAYLAISKWVLVGVAMLTISTWDMSFL